MSGFTGIDGSVDLTACSVDTFRICVWAELAKVSLVEAIFQVRLAFPYPVFLAILQLFGWERPIIRLQCFLFLCWSFVPTCSESPNKPQRVSCNSNAPSPVWKLVTINRNLCIDLLTNYVNFTVLRFNFNFVSNWGVLRPVTLWETQKLWSMLLPTSQAFHDTTWYIICHVKLSWDVSPLSGIWIILDLSNSGWNEWFESPCFTADPCQHNLAIQEEHWLISLFFLLLSSYILHYLFSSCCLLHTTPIYIISSFLVVLFMHPPLISLLFLLSSSYIPHYLFSFCCPLHTSSIEISSLLVALFIQPQLSLLFLLS